MIEFKDKKAKKDITKWLKSSYLPKLHKKMNKSMRAIEDTMVVYYTLRFGFPQLPSVISVLDKESGGHKFFHVAGVRYKQGKECSIVFTGSYFKSTLGEDLDFESKKDTLSEEDALRDGNVFYPNFTLFKADHDEVLSMVLNGEENK